MKIASLSLSLLGAAALASPLCAETADLLTAESYPALAETIRPSAEEIAWLDIPWETDLTAARRKAAAEGKPIFLWEMDGHPLGCT